MSVTSVAGFLALMEDGIEPAVLIDHFAQAGYRRTAVQKALDTMLEKGEAVEIRLVFHADSPVATESPQLPPLPRR